MLFKKLKEGFKENIVCNNHIQIFLVLVWCVCMLLCTCKVRNMCEGLDDDYQVPPVTYSLETGSLTEPRARLPIQQASKIPLHLHIIALGLKYHHGCAWLFK